VDVFVCLCDMDAALELHVDIYIHV
jgi:hypothetical protein